MNEPPLTKEQLNQLRRNLAMLSDDGVRSVYRRAWEECMRGERLPAAKAVQQLVQAWKQLWRWRKVTDEERRYMEAADQGIVRVESPFQ